MEKTLLAFHKPNKSNNGSAIQITRNSKGINLQLARQMTPQSREAQATYNWKKDSFSALINNTELSKIIVAAKNAEKEVERIKLIRKTGGEASINPEELKGVKLPHMNSSAPKTINIKFNEYPAGSLNLTMEINFYGTMMVEGEEFGKKVLKEGQNMSIYLSEDEVLQFTRVLAHELENQLEDNLIYAKIVNLDEPDPKGYNGFRTINEIRVPNLGLGDLITSIKKDLVLEIVKKEFDVRESKIVFYCRKVDING